MVDLENLIAAAVADQLMVIDNFVAVVVVAVADNLVLAGYFVYLCLEDFVDEYFDAVQ